MDKLAIIMISLCLIVLLSFVFGYFTALCWDNSIGEIFKLPPMTFWQGFCLNLLGGFVCKPSISSSKK